VISFYCKGQGEREAEQMLGMIAAQFDGLAVVIQSSASSHLYIPGPPLYCII
jgi:hypothetical protein